MNDKRYTKSDIIFNIKEIEKMYPESSVEILEDYYNKLDKLDSNDSTDIEEYYSLLSEVANTRMNMDKQELQKENSMDKQELQKENSMDKQELENAIKSKIENLKVLGYEKEAKEILNKLEMALMTNIEEVKEESLKDILKQTDNYLTLVTGVSKESLEYTKNQINDFVKKIEKQAEHLNNFIENGEASIKDFPEFIKNGLSPEVIEYWEKNYNTKAKNKEISDFSEELVKECTNKKKEEIKVTEEETKEEIKNLWKEIKELENDNNLKEAFDVINDAPILETNKTDKKFEVTEEDIKYIFENIGSVPEDYKNPKEFEIVNLFNRISQENYQKTPIDKKDYISLIEKSANDILRIIRKDSYDVLTDNQKLLFLKDELEDIERNLVNFKIIQCKNSDLELLSGKIQEAVNVINSNLCLTSSPLYHLVHNRKPSFIDLKVKSIHIGIIKNALYSITDSIALYKALNPVPVYKPTVFSGIISTVNDLETQVAKYTEEDIFAQDALDNAFETKQGIKEAKKKSLEITRKLRMSENLLRDALDKLAELDISDISKLV